MEWMDNLVTSVASEESKLYTLSGEREQGTFVNLSNQEFGKIIAKLTKLRVWASKVINNSLSCGALIMVMRGEGGMSVIKDYLLDCSKHSVRILML